MRPDPFPGPAPARLAGRDARAPLVSPVLFDFWAGRLSPTWRWNRPVARVVARAPAASDAVSLVLKPNRHFRGFRPGQHVNLGVEIDGRRLVRSYSPSAPAAKDGSFRITVKAIESGKVSRYLHDHAKVGDVLTLGQAFGELALPADDGAPRLLLAAGSGITPMMAIFAALAQQPDPPATTLLYSTRRRDQRCFGDELQAIAAAHPRLRVGFLLTGDAAGAGADATASNPASAASLSSDLDTVTGVTITETPGRLSAARLAPWLDTGAHVLACGPAGFVDTARDLLARRVASFAAEAFSPPVFANTDSGTVAVTLARSQRTLEIPRGQPLLDALEAAGLSPPHGCRRGLCNTCACAKASGSTRHLLTGEHESEPVSALRLCVTSARSDLVLDL